MCPSSGPRSDHPNPGEWQALVAREQQQHELLSTMSCLVYRSHAAPPWPFTYLSAGVETLTGYPPSYFLEDGHRWPEIMVPEDVAPVTEALARSAAEGKELQIEYRIRRRDGTVRWVDARVRLLPGDPPMYCGTILDIDQRKRADQALAESREHQRYIIESVPCSLWTAGPDGAIEFVSGAGCTYVGATVEQRVGHGWLDFVHPEDAGGVRRRWHQSLVTGDPYEAGFRQSDLKGGYRWLQARAICRRDAEGQILRWYGTTTDVTDLIQTQAQLQQSEDLASATMRTVPGMVWRADATGTLNFISDACEAQLGWVSADVLGNRWFQLVHPEDAPGLALLWNRALQSGDPIEARYRVKNRQGTYRWHQVRAIAGRDGSGRVDRWYGLAIDIEELLQARLDAESAVRARSAFLSTMSHEIRTPLNAVLGYAALLADTPLSSEQREFVGAIRASGDHLVGVINDILDFSKLESGRLGMDYAPCDLRELIESALDLVASQAASKGLELLYRIEEGVPSHAVMDPARIKQVLVNLLSNAVKFTAAGEIEVTVAARPLATRDMEFEFNVRDTGIGIPVQNLGRLFRDFSQLDDSIARRYGGTGLGLAISKRLVEHHGGCIRVASAPDRGSTFTFCIPARPFTPPARTAPAPAQALKGRRVLVVDDNRSSLDNLCRVLRSWGMDVIGESDPEEGMQRLSEAIGGETGPFDLAILDQRMPAMSGRSLARRLQARAPMPVLLLTNLGATVESGETMADERCIVQNKPVHHAALYESVCEILKAPLVVATPQPTSPADIAPMPKLRLLLAEDNPANRKVAQLLLRKLGYPHIDFVVNGREAVAAVQTRDYDVVLMDMQMPELDGLDATRRIRREVVQNRRPQIVALTANATLDDREACSLAGMDGYLAKPIELSCLAQALRAAAERLERQRASVVTP